MKLVLAGGSSHSDSYLASLRAHQSERIKFLDWLSGEALEEVLTNAALFVLPSDMEGMSLALLDAMGAGICVLASDIPVLKEIGGDYPRYFDADAYGALEHAVRELELGLGPTVRLRRIPRAWLSWGGRSPRIWPRLA